MEIYTRRLKIRGFEEKDIALFAEYRNNGEWMKFQSFKNKSEEEYRRFLLKEGSPEEGIQYAVADRETDRLIGDIYLKKDGEGVWIGYAINPAYSRKGLMYEALCAFITSLNEKSPVKISAGTETDNIPSQRLLKKLGFSFLRFDGDENENIYILEQLKR